MIGIDTCSIIDFLNGEPSIVSLIENLDEELVVNSVIYFELMMGINTNNKNHFIEEKKIDFLFDCLNNFNLTKKASKKASSIKWGLRKKGVTITKEDCLISAIFLENGINKIITRDKHFEKIKGLKVLSY